MNRKLALFLCSTLAISLACTSCTTSYQSSGSASSADEASVSSTADSSADDGEYTVEKDDAIMQGVIDSHDTIEKFADTPTYEYTMMLQNPPLEDNTYGQQLYEKLFNVKVSIVRTDDAEQRKVYLAAQKTPDIVRAADVDEYASFAAQGLFTPITEELVKENMPEYYERMTEADPTVFRDLKIDGQIMGLVKLNFASHVEPAVIRADWLKNVGIDKVPTTLDELEAAFVAFREDDPDQNGVKDTYAFTTASDSTERLFQSIFGIFDINPFFWTEDDNGDLVYGFTTERCKEALMKLSEWYKMGIIDPEFITDKRRNDQTDISLKFATGRIGYMDCLDFADYQWDNDGQLNAKWVANNADWQEWFKEREGTDEINSIGAVTDFDDSMLDPYYIVMAPVKGPYGEGAYRYAGYESDYFMFGSSIMEEDGKLEKLLQIMDYMGSDLDTYAQFGLGFEGLNWEYDSDGNIQSLANASLHPTFNTRGQIVGTGKFFCTMWNANEAFLTEGGAHSEQRYGLLAPAIEKFNSIIDLVRSPLPSQTEYDSINDSALEEYIVNAIIDGNVEETFDAEVEKWYNNGGTELTKEANAWYNQ